MALFISELDYIILLCSREKIPLHHLQVRIHNLMERIKTDSPINIPSLLQIVAS